LTYLAQPGFWGYVSESNQQGGKIKTGSYSSVEVSVTVPLLFGIGVEVMSGNSVGVLSGSSAGVLMVGPADVGEEIHPTTSVVINTSKNINLDFKNTAVSKKI